MSLASIRHVPECDASIFNSFASEIAKIIYDYSKMGIKFFFFVEPALFETAAEIYALLGICSKHAMVDGHPIVFTNRRGVSNENGISVLIDINPDEQTLKSYVKSSVMELERVRLVVVPGMPSYSPSNSLVVEMFLKYFISRKLSSRKRYVGRIPYKVIFFGTEKEMEDASKKFRAPPPPFTSFLEKNVPRRFDEIVVPRDTRVKLLFFINNTLRTSGYGSVLLVGLPGSGRKTIAYYIGRKVGYPVYYLPIMNILSRYVGESEQRISTILTYVKYNKSVLVIEGLSDIKKGGERDSSASTVFSNIFNKIVEFLKENDNSVIVFSETHTVDPEVLGNQLIGEIKGVLTPPEFEERMIILRRFVSELVKEIGPDKLRRISGKKPDDLVEYFVRGFIDYTAGMTVGEIKKIIIDDILKPFLLVSIQRGELKERKLYTLIHRDLTGRITEVSIMRDVARRLGLVETIEKLEHVYNELQSLQDRMRSRLK